MKSEGRLRRILLLTVILTMLTAGCAMAENLSARTYTLSSSGYIAWSDFTIPASETVTVNVATSTVNKAGLTQKTLNSLTYEVLNAANGSVLYRFTRNGSNRYVQVKSSKSQVYDRLSVTLPAGSYRFRVTNTAAPSQPVVLSYAVTDTRVASSEYILTAPVSVTVGQVIQIPVRNNKGELVKVTSAKSSASSVAKVKRSGNNLVITGKKAGTAIITLLYQGKYYQFQVTVTTRRPEFQAYIRKISASGKYLYVRVRNMGDLPITFYSSGAKEYTASITDNNKVYAVKLVKLKFAKGTSKVIQPGKWTTIKLTRKSGVFPNRSVAGIEVRLYFRYDSVKYTSAVEDNWLDGQYHLRKKTAVWYPAYSAKNNFS